MKYIHFSILGKTLCGKEDEPVPEHLADSRRFCDDCVQVMWKEQYRRRIFKKTIIPENRPTHNHIGSMRTKEGAVVVRKFKPLIKYLR